MTRSIQRNRQIQKLILVYLLNISDWLCTQALLHFDLFYEANPIARLFVTDASVGFLTKVLITGVLVLLMAIVIFRLDAEGLNVTDRFISFIFVFYLVVNLDHILNFTLLILQISP